MPSAQSYVHIYLYMKMFCSFDVVNSMGAEKGLEGGGKGMGRSGNGVGRGRFKNCIIVLDPIHI